MCHGCILVAEATFALGKPGCTFRDPIFLVSPLSTFLFSCLEFSGQIPTGKHDRVQPGDPRSARV